MPETIEERIYARIQELEAERDKYVADANVVLKLYETSIGELKKILEPIPQRSEEV